MAHFFSDELDLKLNRLRAIRRSSLPLRSDNEALRLLLSTQDAFHTLAMARDGEDRLTEKLSS